MRATCRKSEASGNLAYCWSALRVEVTPRESGNAAVRVGNALSILRKQDGGAWVLIRDANMLAPAAAVSNAE